MPFLKKILPVSLWLVSAIVATPALAWYEYPDYLPNEMASHLEIAGAFGPNWTHSDSTHLTVSKYETDSILEDSATNSSLWKLGIGYHLFEDRLKHNPFFTDLLVSLNVYQSTQTIHGHVLQYQEPQLDNYDFNAPVTSTRLLFEIRPSLFTAIRVSPYPIVGVGVAWNNMSYDETAKRGIDPASSFSLNVKSNCGFTYNLGAGARIDLIHQLTMSVEYLYSYLGSATPSGSAPPPTGLLDTPSFILHSQAVLVGLNYKLG